jgi:beta-lactamase class A
VTILVLGGAWLYTNWLARQAVLPAGLLVNGQPMGGMTRDQVLNELQISYTYPVSLTYAGQPIAPLLPEMIELHLDLPATIENLDEAVQTDNRFRQFLSYIADQLLGRQPQPIEVSAVVSYSRERVNTFLTRIAQKYDHVPQPAVPLPEAGTFRPPITGTKLDVDASLPPLIEAILALKPEDRYMDLVVVTEPAPEPSSNILAVALQTSLADFTDTGGISGIYARDLQTGQEMCINCDVAYAGLSILKIGIGLKLYAIQEDRLTPEQEDLIDGMLIESDNASANLILAEIGAGNPYTGALMVTDFFWSLGLQNTFLAVPYDLKEGIAEPDIVTPANSRPEPFTDPDPYIQTTPKDMGLLLEGLYHCTKGGGFLRLLFPHDLEPRECDELLGWLKANGDDSLLGRDMPEGTVIMHKHGWRDNVHADAALVYGLQADFVVTAFLYQPEWFVWEESVPTFGTIGKLTYRFYNGEINNGIIEY